MYVNLHNTAGFRKAINLATLVMQTPDKFTVMPSLLTLTNPKDTMTEEAIKPTKETK